MGPRSFISPFNLAARQANIDQAGAPVPVRLRDSVCSIVRCVALMKRVFSNPLAALTAGLCLRLFFVLKFPANSGDTVLYEQIATNWLKHHVYAMTVGGEITPVDLRMPGYPAFLVIIYALTGRTGADERAAGADRCRSSFLPSNRHAGGTVGVQLASLRAVQSCALHRVLDCGLV